MRRGFLAKEYESGRMLHSPPPAPPKERHGMEHEFEDPVKLVAGLERTRAIAKEQKAREALAEEQRVNPRTGPSVQATTKEFFKRFHANDGNICISRLRLRGKVHTVFMFANDRSMITFNRTLVESNLNARLSTNKLAVRSSRMVLDDPGAAAAPGDLLLLEYPLLSAPELDPKDGAGRTSYEQLLRNVVGKLSTERQEEFNALPTTRNGDSPGGVKEYLAIMKSNGICIQDSPSDKSLSYIGIFATLSRVKHSCRPNACMHWHGPSASVSLRATRTIVPGEEITISLLTSRELLKPAAERRAILQKRFDCKCVCRSCEGSANEIAASDARRFELARTPAPRQSAWFRWAGNAKLAHEAAEYAEPYLIDQSRRAWELYEREGLIEPGEDGLDGWSHAAQLMGCYLALCKECDALFWAKQVVTRAAIFQQDKSFIPVWDAERAIADPKNAISWNTRRKGHLFLDELEARQLF